MPEGALAVAARHLPVDSSNAVTTTPMEGAAFS